MIEVKEMLRLWLDGRGYREVARLSGTDRKTVRRYVDRARACGLDRDGDACQLTDELLAAVIAEVRPSRPNGKSQTWEIIDTQREQVQAWLKQDLTLTKVHTLLGRRGVVVSYRTLHRYATTELGLGNGGPRCRWPIVSRQRTAGRLRSTRAAHRHRGRPPAGGAWVDLHRGVFAAHVRLAHLPADPGRGDRRVRSGVGVLWWGVRGGDPGQHEDHRG
ncbi:hypothetical protein MOTT12_04683 [Mycobacterium intracellulare subsp. yongonense]|nr:hypothetical protein MOTT12_04683 [Mycobacterium intracellulare subsp. yongonense]